MGEAAERPAVIWGFIAFLAGVLTLVGGRMNWGEFSGPLGVFLVRGAFPVVLMAAILVGAGIVLFRARLRGVRAVFAAAALVVGFVVTLLGTRAAFDDSFYVGRAAREFASDGGSAGHEQLEAVYESALERGEAEVSIQVGAYLVLAGGLLGLLGGLGGLTRRRTEPSEKAAAPSPVPTPPVPTPPEPFEPPEPPTPEPFEPPEPPTPPAPPEPPTPPPPAATF